MRVLLVFGVVFFAFVSSSANASCVTVLECAQQSVEAAKTATDAVIGLEERLIAMERKIEGAKIITRRITSSRYIDSQRISCAEGEVVTSCMALQVPSGQAICSSSMDGGSCSSSGCAPPSGQSYVLIADCARIDY